jgi:hypothetical protein
VLNSEHVNVNTTIDLEKAYDTVWINGLIFKLICFKFPMYLIKFIHSYLSNRSFSVTLSDISSPIKYTAAGLPQGAVLSPLLFSIYMADFPRLPHIHTALYADDTAIYSSIQQYTAIYSNLQQYSHSPGGSTLSLADYHGQWTAYVNIAPDGD